MNETSLQTDLYKRLIDNLYDGVYFVDPERRITYWNRGAERITGYLSEAVVGTCCNQNLLKHVTDNGKQLCEDGCPLLATLQDGEQRETEVHLRHADGYRVPVLVRTSPVWDEKQNIVGAVEVFSNNLSLFVMRRKMTELERKALVDSLTGLANRGYAESKIRSALLEYGRHSIPFGLLMIDVDRFKSINDAHGHPVGDRVLQTIAHTLTLHLRDSDTCGRWGGEEFIIALMNMNEHRLSLVAEKLRALIEASVVKVGEREVTMTISIGATLVRPVDTFDSLLERADDLLYRSKQAGRNQVTLEL
jgi:diguanylate cyclase (GGDEF)-like protein/PAS domain S-box-containing protein